MNQLIYSAQCPNCTRFIGALDRTKVRDTVAKVDVGTLAPHHRQHVTAVPMLLMSNGSRLVGTKAFEWLKQFEGDAELESFAVGKGLAFSHVEDVSGLLSYSTPYGDFQPVP